MATKPTKYLETFPNPAPERDYIIHIETPEFTCLCPKTGQPDFATLYLDYVPDRLCVELKSLKLYIWSYRDQGAFHEAVTDAILNDLVAAIAPRYMHLMAQFNVRGGIYTTVEAEFRKPGWTPPPAPPDYLPRENHIVSGRIIPDAEGGDSDAASGTDTPAPPSKRFRMLGRARRRVTTTDSPPETPGAAARGEADEKPPAPPGPPRPEPVFLGIDLGSTGCRVVAIDARGDVLAHLEAPLPPPMVNDNQITQDPTQWWKAASACLRQLRTGIDLKRVRSIAVDGTSGTLLLCDKQGAPVTPALMYNDQRALEQAEAIAATADRPSGAHGAASSLAKLLWLQQKKLDKRAVHALHPADWMSGQLTGNYGHSDYNNCLKLGYDAEKLQWPDWLGQLGANHALLPQVHAPGDVLAPISSKIAKSFGFLPDTQVVAGTTDGVAAFLAAGAHEPGHGVTVLGSTLVLKLLSADPVFAPEFGVYSQRLGHRWLAGGASNSGGAVLRQYFDVEQMRAMTPQLDPEQWTDLDYYPLPRAGERFPVNDPEMAPRLEPLPGDSVTFFQGILEGIARIEAQGYALLEELGAPKVAAVWTTGGGSHNPAWQRLRERMLDIEIMPARSEFAAYGTALLAAGMVAKTF